MPRDLNIEDERYSNCEKLAEMAGFASAEEFIAEVLRRRTRAVLETFGLYEKGRPPRAQNDNDK